MNARSLQNVSFGMIPFSTTLVFLSSSIRFRYNMELADSCESPTRPRLLVGLDVETSDWDAHVSFAKQSYHFHMGFPCQANHQSYAGHVCGLGYCVFVQTPNESNCRCGSLAFAFF